LIVGSFGRTLDGFRVVTASLRRRPFSMWFVTVERVEKLKSISPESSAMVVGPPPL